MRKRILLIIATCLTAVLAGCSSFNAAHNHNAPTATNGPHTFAHWFWFQSPGSFQTVIYTCVEKMAIYETQDNAYPIVVHNNDPLCGGNGTGPNIP